jgi:hypothetical protein
MKLLRRLQFPIGKNQKSIELLTGDLTRMPARHAVDALIVSAFLGDFVPTASSLVGALDRVGLSVANLSERKAVDLRQQYGSWLSRPIKGFNFSRVICIESGWIGGPIEIASNLFRTVGPYILAQDAIRSIAMPIIGSGDQANEPAAILAAVLNSAVDWMDRGLPLEILKIVIREENPTADLIATFEQFAAQGRLNAAALRVTAANRQTADAKFDVFISYSHSDQDIARIAFDSLKKSNANLLIFIDEEGLREGSQWLLSLARSLDESARVMTLYSEDYWASKYCQLEFQAAFVRQMKIKKSVLFPVFLSNAEIPTMFQLLQYNDCRVNDRTKLAAACGRLADELRVSA